MTNQERLFLAIGEAEPELVICRERTRRSRWPGYCLTAAACLALVLTASRVLPLWTDPSTGAPAEPPEALAPGTESPAGNGKPDAGGQTLSLPERGGEIGTLRLLSYAPQSQEASVDFLIYINEEQFTICEENGLYSIRSTSSLPEDFPECGLDILHLSGTAPDEARTDAESAAKEHYGEVSAEDLSAPLPDALYLRASAGSAWDDEQAELWFVSDGQGGSFVLTARCFLEAEEGLGARFRDMVSSFRVISPDKVEPAWMASLREAADRLFPALFSNDLSGVSDLLAGNAEADAYSEDVWDDLTVASVDYALNNDRDPSSATVSVKHRLNLTEGESYNYLTMELVRQDGQWRLAWSGIEK